MYKYITTELGNSYFFTQTNTTKVQASTDLPVFFYFISYIFIYVSSIPYLSSLISCHHCQVTSCVKEQHALKEIPDKNHDK